MNITRALIGAIAVVALAVVVFVVVQTRKSSESSEPWASTLRRSVKPLALVAVGLFLAIQLVPYGRDHENPPVVAEPPWDSVQTRDLAVGVCFDCHSNETIWPWYSNIAPMSWLVQRDVNRGRSDVNWSEWMVDGDEDESDESAESVEDGSMPLSQYVWLHPQARLSDSEMEALSAGLAATFGRHDD